MGYCGYGSFGDLASSLSNTDAVPSDAALAEGKIMTDTYNDPDLIGQQCMPYLVKDLGMLFALGCALRVATYIFLAYKGARR